MTFYSGLSSTASRLLQSKGQLVTFSRDTSTSFDGATGKEQSSASTFTGYGAAFNYNRKEIGGSLIQDGDIRFVMEATTTAPINGDTTTIDGVIYRVMSVKVTSPAGTVVIYELQLRR